MSLDTSGSGRRAAVSRRLALVTAALAGASHRELFDRVRRFVEEFRKRHGAITCSELLRVQVFTREGRAEGRRRGLFRERCPRYVRDAITMLESVGDGPECR